MRYATAILGGLVGGLLAALVAAFATTRILPDSDALYDAGNLAAAFALAALGGVVGVVVGWLVQRRRSWGLGGIAAIVSLLAAAGGTYGWGREAAAMDETGLFVVGGILMFGIGLIGMVAVCGLTAALLRHRSVAPAPPQ